MQEKKIQTKLSFKYEIFSRKQNNKTDITSLDFAGMKNKNRYSNLIALAVTKKVSIFYCVEL